MLAELREAFRRLSWWVGRLHGLERRDAPEEQRFACIGEIKGASLHMLGLLEELDNVLGDKARELEEQLAVVVELEDPPDFAGGRANAEDEG